MEKDNKYYEIIKKIVENNKKYVDYEEILDDIIDDVYSHSQTVISSINDNAVIEGYLTKVVNTSLITVPKKLGFKKKVEKPTPYEPIFVPQTQEIKVNTEYVDRMINGAVLNENKTEKPEEALPVVEDFSEEVSIPEVEVEYKEEKTPNAFEQDDVVELEGSKQLKEEELTFVDNNEDVANESIESSETEPIFDEPKEFEPSDIFELPNDAEFTEQQEDKENDDNFSELEFGSPDDEVVELNSYQQVPSDNVFEIQKNDIETIDLVDVESTDNGTLSPIEANLVENDVMKEASEVDLFESEEIINNDFVDDLVNNAEDNVLEGSGESDLIEDMKVDDLSLLQEDFGEEIVDDIEPADKFSISEDISKTNNISEQKFVDFSSLEAELKQENALNINKEEITNKLNKLIASQATLDLAKIYDLKYNQNLEIGQIASKLGITEDAVAEALKEIVDIL